jgi:hypothetical protein
VIVLLLSCNIPSSSPILSASESASFFGQVMQGQAHNVDDLG